MRSDNVQNFINAACSHIADYGILNGGGSVPDFKRLLNIAGFNQTVQYAGKICVAAADSINYFNIIIRRFFIKFPLIKDFGVEVSKSDSILTLSTCANNNKYRVVLHAKKII